MILAAGEGKRMKSRTAKVLHQVSGRALIDHVVAGARAVEAEPVAIVIGVQGDAVREHVATAHPGADIRFAEQPRQLGTGDAVRQARLALGDFDGDVLILCGDVPALRADALRPLLRRHRQCDAALTVLTAELEDPAGYGRVVRGAEGRVEAIVEHRDASPEQRQIREINSGTYCARWPLLLEVVEELRPDNEQGEYYLTDAVRLLLARGERVEAVVHPRAEEALGVNSRRQLAALGAALNQRRIEQLMDAGVTVLDPATTWVHETVSVGQDTVLHPGVTLEGPSRIGRGCVVRSGCRLTRVRVGDGAELLDHTVAEDVEIGRHTKVGPFAHLRPGTVLGPDCKVGNFVETKKARFGAGSKASHLSYLGDAQIGKGVNVGAGTITCNYDGQRKHVTELGDGVFIGSDTQLVAPVKVGKGSYVGAGSTITKDVPPGALALSRAPQKNVEGWVARKKQKGRD
jgi:bifunctional UDP-N-acetylglucosamine pyrophosphorylase/glucosamine-1-phosphate N-acetyltransferase